jgi:hypothetical protein
MYWIASSCGPGWKYGGRILLELCVGDRDVHGVAEVLEVVEGELLHLVRGVATLEVRAQRPALDGLREDDRRLALDAGSGLIRGVHLAVVVAAALQAPDLLVGPALDKSRGAVVPAEEVLANECAVLALVGLKVAIRGVVHQADERAVAILGQQLVPFATPHDLDDVPSRAAEEALELLDDLAVATDGAVESLQVAVDDESEVVELLARGQRQGAHRINLVGLAVAEEGPHALVGGVLDAAVVQVLVEACLVDRVEGPDAHRHGRELPEPGHEPRMRVRRQAATRVRDLLTEAVELVLGQAALDVRAGVHARGRVALEEDLVAAAGVVRPAEEVVEAHFVQRRRGGVAGDVAADGDARALRAMHHDRGVPADDLADALLEGLVARERGLALRRDGVDVVGAAQAGHTDVPLGGATQQRQHQVARPVAARLIHDVVEGLDPLGRLVGIGVDVLGGESAGEQRISVTSWGHGEPFDSAGGRDRRSPGIGWCGDCAPILPHARRIGIGRVGHRHYAAQSTSIARSGEDVRREAEEESGCNSARSLAPGGIVRVDYAEEGGTSAPDRSGDP